MHNFKTTYVCHMLNLSIQGRMIYITHSVYSICYLHNLGGIENHTYFHVVLSDTIDNLQFVCRTLGNWLDMGCHIFHHKKEVYRISRCHFAFDKFHNLVSTITHTWIYRTQVCRKNMFHFACDMSYLYSSLDTLVHIYSQRTQDYKKGKFHFACGIDVRYSVMGMKNYTCFHKSQLCTQSMFPSACNK